MIQSGTGSAEHTGYPSLPGSRAQMTMLRGLLASEPGVRVMALTAMLLTGVAFGYRLWLLQVQQLSPDELQHLHIAWSIWNGSLPYRDFFDHHTPWFHFALAPFYRFFDVERDADAAIGFIFFGRYVAWLLSGVILTLTFWLGRLWKGLGVASVGVLFLANSIVFLEKSIEIRPDVLGVAFWLAGLVAVVAGLRPDPGRDGGAWRFAASGAFLGAAVMCTQKFLFALPGFGAAMVWYLVAQHSHTGARRLRNVSLQAAAFSVPVLLTAGYFATQDGLGRFVEFNFLWNASWKVRFSPAQYLLALVAKNPFDIGFGAFGLGMIAVFLRRRGASERGDVVVLFSTVGLLGGLFAIPVPYKQYYMTFLPLVALLAAAGLVEAVGWVSRGRASSRAPIIRRVGVTAAVMAAAAAIWYGAGAPGVARLVGRVGEVYALVAERSLEQSDPRLTVAAVAVPMVAVGAAGLAWGRRRAVAFVLVGVSVFPFSQMWHVGSRSTNLPTLDGIRYVMESVAPTETVMDGWTGLGVFRPHAYFFFFLHEELRAMLTDDERRRLVEDLEAGRIAPKLVILDKDLRAVSDDLTRFVEERYEPVGRHDIWKRKGTTRELSLRTGEKVP